MGMRMRIPGGRGRDLTHDSYVLSDFGMNKLLTSLYFLEFLPHLYFYLTLHLRMRDQPFAFERKKPEEQVNITWGNTGGKGKVL